MSLLVLFNQECGEPPDPTDEGPVFSVSGVYAPSAEFRAHYRPTESNLQAVDDSITTVTGGAR